MTDQRMVPESIDVCHSAKTDAFNVGKKKKCVCYCNLDIPVSKVTKTELDKFIVMLSTKYN